MADVQYAKQQVDNAEYTVEQLQSQLQQAESQVEEAKENLDTELDAAKDEVVSEEADQRKAELEDMAS